MGELDDLARAASDVETEAVAAGEPPPRRSYAKPHRSDAKMWGIVLAATIGIVALIAIIIAMNQDPIQNVEMKHPDAGVGGPSFFGVGGDKK